MNFEINRTLLEELEEANGYFENIVLEIKNDDPDISLDNYINKVRESFQESMQALDKMDNILVEYNLLHMDNHEFFNGEKKIVMKYVFLYMVSIIMIKVFSKTLSSVKINEIWYAFVGMLLGTVNTKMLCSNLDAYRKENKNVRNMLNEDSSLKEEYDKYFAIALGGLTNIQTIIRSLNRHLDDSKSLVKTIKGM